MIQHYHSGLVFLSLLVAILASYTALTLALRIRSSAGWPARAWLLGGGFAMGVGIWAMHFVGMLALSLPIPIGYDISITALSMLIAIVVSTFALRIASRSKVTRARMVAAGIAMGIGICSMHYVGMAAILIEPPIRYSPYWVAASLAIAIAASFSALWIAFRTYESDLWRYRLLGGIVMGFAIVGMHYAGMVAAHFPDGAASKASSLLNTGWLAGAVTTISLFILFATLLISLIDAQAAARRGRIQASLAESQQQSRAKDEFLAMLGHELRNPLASITSAIFLLDRAEPRSSEWNFARDVISRQASHLRRMVDDLLDVGRAISGKMSLEPRPVDLDRMVRATLDTLTAAGRTRSRRLDYQGTNVWVNGDATRLEQMVTNLILNAVEHSPEEGLIEVHVSRLAGNACLNVRDYGAGLEPETAPQIFDLFYQASQGIQRAKGGLGIGLTLVRRIVELHGGRVSVFSRGLGEGALFKVELPATEVPQPSPATHRRSAKRAQCTVLVVEDADDARDSLRRILESEGHNVHAEKDGVGGLKALLELHPHIALVDIGLPELDGYEIARRARSAGVRTRLVAISGYGLPQDKAQAADAGFDAHLTKPADPHRVLALVSEAACA